MTNAIGTSARDGHLVRRGVPGQRRPHVVLVNAWHDDNKGDSAITEGVLRLVSEICPESRVSVVGLTEHADPSSDAMRHVARSHPQARLYPNPMPSELRGDTRATPLVDVPIWFTRLLPPVAATLVGRVPGCYRRLFADADLVIGVGGSNLYTDVSVQPLVSLARLFTLVAPLNAAVRLRIPTVLLGHTLGPFPRSRPGARLLARRMLAGVSATVVRDETSLRVARALGVTDAELAPDMAYAITAEHSDRVRDLANPRTGGMARTAVVAMRSHPSLGDAADDRLIGEIVDAVRSLTDQGYIDHVLVVAHTLGPTPIEDDRAVSRSVREALHRRAIPCTYIDDDLGPAELAALYGYAACMIAVRLHAAVLATLSGTPTFAIAYFSAKSEGVMRTAGLADAVGTFAEVTGSEIVEALTRQMTSPDGRSRLASVADAHRETLRRSAYRWLAPITTDPDTHPAHTNEEPQ